MTTFADLQRLRKPATASITLQLDGTLRDQQAHLRRRIAAARQAASGSQVSEHLLGLADPEPDASLVQQLETELDELRQAGQASEVTFTFQAVGHAFLEELQLAHPPTAAQKVEGYGHNPDTFGPALLAACLVEPSLTPSEAGQLWRDWPPGLVNTLWRSAWDLCHAVQVSDPFSETAFVATPASVPN